MRFLFYQVFYNIFATHSNKSLYHNSMTLIVYILIAIPVCLLAIALWTYLDFRKYKKKNSCILLLFLFYPFLSYAQYTDNEHCNISFTSYENQPGKLEHTKDNMIFQFVPADNAWQIIIKNNADEDIRVNWEKASFIINGRASGVSFHPFTTDETPTDIIKNNSEIARTVTASNLIVEKKVNKIYNKLNLRKGGRTSVNIILPVGIGNKPQFFHIFNFIVTHVD